MLPLEHDQCARYEEAFRGPLRTRGESKQCLTMRKRCTFFFPPSIARATEAVLAMLFRQVVMLDGHGAACFACRQAAIF